MKRKDNETVLKLRFGSWPKRPKPFTYTAGKTKIRSGKKPEKCFKRLQNDHPSNDTSSGLEVGMEC